MAIVFPRELPSYHVQSCFMEYSDNVASSVNRNNSLNLTQVIPEAWTVSVETGLLQPNIRAQWSAWKKSLRGGLKTFVAHDAARLAPLNYPNARSPGDIQGGWNGTASVSLLGLSGALRLSGLPGSYVFKAGDRVGLEQVGRYGYYEVLEDATAIGGVANITVAPFLHTSIFTIGAVARIWRPKCQFIIDWQSWAEVGTREPSSISFQGYQRL